MNAACKPRWLARLTLLGAVALAVTACVDERSFVITGTIDECIEGDGTALIFAGRLDISAGKGYYFSPIVRNDMLSTNSEDGEPERNILQLEGFEVELDVPGGAPSKLTNRFSHAAGSIEPEGGTLEIRGVELISPELVASLSDLGSETTTIIATVRARASHNGSTLTSVEYTFPVEICSGCLVIDAGDCPSTKPSGAISNECGWPQDAPVFCCNASGTQVCLDRATLDALPEDK